MNLSQKVESQVKKTLQEIKLPKKEKILVALSGGKDSTAVAYLLKKLGYNIYGFHINLKIGKYSEDCLKAVQELCTQNKIPLEVYDIKKEMGASMCYLRSTIQNSQKGKGLKNCAICGVIKKWIFNKEARKLKADKIATGHNLDDEVQTFLMNIFKGSPNLSANSGAITQNQANKKFIPRIKPLFYVLEEDVRNYVKQKGLPVNFAKCPCSYDSYRIQLRSFLEKLPGKQKENLMKSFNKLHEKLSKNKDTRMVYCEICGEPARNSICKKCELMGMK